jgi:hypothetical protein
MMIGHHGALLQFEAGDGDPVGVDGLASERRAELFKRDRLPSMELHEIDGVFYQ